MFWTLLKYYWPTDFNIYEFFFSDAYTWKNHMKTFFISYMHTNFPIDGVYHKEMDSWNIYFVDILYS